MKRDKEGHYIMIKGSIQEEDKTIIYIYIHTYIHTYTHTHNQHRSTTICKANANKYEWGN